MNHARELTRLAHPVPDSMPPGSLFLGLPIGGSQAAATYSARGPAGPTPWEQALRQVSKRGRPSHKLSEAYNLALAARIHRGGFAAPEIPQAAHMGRVLPQGISIPLYTLRRRFITRSAFPVSSDATAWMQDDSGRVLPQTCA